MRDYLWRWDTDWFWCSRAFGAQNPRIRRLWPKRWLRSDVYWKLIRLENRYHVAARLDGARGCRRASGSCRTSRSRSTARPTSCDWFLREVPIEPVWLCPLRLRDRCPARRADGTPWPLYPLRPDETYVNVGFWSTVAIEPGAADGDVNRQIEAVVTPSTAATSRSTPTPTTTRRPSAPSTAARPTTPPSSGTTPSGRLLDLYEKAVQRR